MVQRFEDSCTALRNRFAALRLFLHRLLNSANPYRTRAVAARLIELGVGCERGKAACKDNAHQQIDLTNWYELPTPNHA